MVMECLSTESVILFAENGLWFYYETATGGVCKWYKGSQVTAHAKQLSYAISNSYIQF